MRFQDAARDGRSVVYAAIQADPLVARTAGLLSRASLAERILARAAMNGESNDPERWRRMFPGLFGAGTPGGLAEEVLAAALAVADRGDQVRSQVRGAVVEELTARLLVRRAPASAVRRERRILFDGVAAEIHPYDVTVEVAGAAEAFDCKWGARGINADVLHQLDDAQAHATDEEEQLSVTLVVFDAERSCRVRLEAQTAPRDHTRLVALEQLDELARPPGAGG